MNIARGFSFELELLNVQGVDEVHITQRGGDDQPDSLVVMTAEQFIAAAKSVKRVAENKGG